MVPLVALTVPFADDARRKTGRHMECNELIGGSLGLLDCLVLPLESNLTPVYSGWRCRAFDDCVIAQTHQF